MPDNMVCCFKEVATVKPNTVPKKCFGSVDAPEHLRKAYAAEAQVTRFANTGSLDSLPGWHAAICSPSRTASFRATPGLGTLLQISGFQGQALGRSLAGLVVEHRQLWLSQVKVPNTDKSALLEVPISPGYTFGPAVEEILQCSHKEQEASQQVAAMLPSRAPA
ncbi:UNVERIFIED_CONTAM: hypothetical protein FKN15_063331 [Acipenser sinensis]